MFDIDKASPVLFCGHSASGGGMYSGILDFHPELLVYPHESKFFQIFHPYTELMNFSPSKKIDYIINKNFEFLKGGFFDVCKADKNYFDFEKFISIFREEAKKKDSWDNYFKSMIIAYAKVTPQKLDDIKYYIERTSSTEIYALEILKKLPNAKFIHNIRDPRDNYASIKSRWNKKLKNLSDSDTIEALRQTSIMRGRLGIDMGIHNFKLLGKKNYLFTKYDEMVKDPNAELTKISDFLNIDSSKFNLIPTFCGLKWPGNNMDKKKFTKISSSQSGSWKNRITDEEAALMEFHFKDVFENFGFEFHFTSNEQVDAARDHYKWLNHFSKFKADFSLASVSKV
tara:strand:+ start:248 stop:1270 length:1023 start_codon:yes stop_codon:yes gene_type:complete